MADSFSLPPGRLEEQFEDKAPPLEEGEALMEAGRCLYCYDAPCITACPTSIDIPTFIKKIASENLTGSARTILKANLLGASCSRVCPVEVLCEGACVYNQWNHKPIEIGRLQRHAMDHAASVDLLPMAPPTGLSVGLIGAGPASLACAGTLALLGHETVLYERDEFPGGLNTTGVAPYKMSSSVALLEVDFIRELGVTIQTGVEVGTDVTGAELLKRHRAVFLGPGLGPDSTLGIPGEDGRGVIGAVDWIRKMKTTPGFSIDAVKSAAVIGGGNTALDAARELAQLGVPRVRLIYRRSEEAMKGYHHEWMPAKKEGVVLIPDAIASEIVHQNGRVKELRLVRAKNGRPTPQSTEPIPVDLVILAIGQAKLRKVVTEFPGVQLDEKGRIIADDETLVTGNPRVFTGGDAHNGGKEVVNAADEGQRAARAIHKLLTGGTDA